MATVEQSDRGASGKKGRVRRPYAARMPIDERRTQLLDVTLQIIAERGIGGVTIDAVSKVADISRSVIYRIFDDADDILWELLDREEEYARGRIAQIVPLDSTDPQVWLDATQRLFEEMAAEPIRWKAFLLPPGGNPGPAEERLEAWNAEMAVTLSAVLRKGIPGKDIDHELIAQSLVSLMLDGARRVLGDPKTYPPKRVVDAMRQVLARLTG
ncbi:TetR/AcrR family transcriptional regulator [Flexivirga meconopsidis]|uniref:TetR/AcrR family transcriptional regulator n=1 Tax=Flexivirga meconopsidis TaxID=2977121 RepID=UPI0022406A3B|nr:TetR/AcrR family transcriptional regulator [Flexivirga meconopsidis]